MSWLDRFFGKIALVAGTVTAMGAFASPVSAQSATANLTVTATVTNNCTISTAPVVFGSYDPVVAHASTNLDATGSLTVACTRGATASMALGLGTNATGSTRRMSAGGANFLTYDLYKEAARTTVWGNSGGAVQSTGAAPSKAPRNFTVYGRVPSNQDVVAGNYSDTVVATVNF